MQDINFIELYYEKWKKKKQCYGARLHFKLTNVE